MSDVLVLLQSSVVVDVESIEDAPAAAIELYRESLDDESMAVRFDCYHYEDGYPVKPSFVIVGGKEVARLP